LHLELRIETSNVCYKVGLAAGDYCASRVCLAGFRVLLLREGKERERMVRKGRGGEGTEGEGSFLNSKF